ncbi:MAG: hypothetical protein AAF844_18640 [Pseudomonadota bacterium]
MIEIFSVNSAAKAPLPASLAHFLAGLALLGWRNNRFQTDAGTA